LAHDLFDKQTAYFATDVTKTHEWRIDQLDRLSRMLKETNERFSETSRRDFKTALPENMNIGFLLLRLVVELILASRGTQKVVRLVRRNGPASRANGARIAYADGW
jgi:hypothetical protein